MGIGVRVDRSRRVADYVQYRIVVVFPGGQQAEPVWRRFRELWAVFAALKAKYAWTPDPPARTPFRPGFWFRLSEDEVRKRRLHIETHLRALIAEPGLLRENPALRALIGYNRHLLTQVLAGAAVVLQTHSECLVRARYLAKWAAFCRSGRGEGAGEATVSRKDIHRIDAALKQPAGAAPTQESSSPTSGRSGELSVPDIDRLLKKCRRRLSRMGDQPQGQALHPASPRATLPLRTSIAAAGAEGATSPVDCVDPVDLFLGTPNKGSPPAGTDPAARVSKAYNDGPGASVTHISVYHMSNAPYEALAVTNPCLPIVVTMSFRPEVRDGVTHYRIDVDDGGEGAVVWKRYSAFCALRDELELLGAVYEAYPSVFTRDAETRRGKLETWLQTVVANVQRRDEISLVREFLEPRRVRVGLQQPFEELHLRLCPYQAFQHEEVIISDDEGDGSQSATPPLAATRLDYADGDNDGDPGAPIALPWERASPASERCASVRTPGQAATDVPAALLTETPDRRATTSGSEPEKPRQGKEPIPSISF